MLLSLNDAWQHARRRGRVVRQFRSVENTKDLGLTISSDLSWGKHVLATVNRANMVLGLMKRSIETNNQDVFCSFTSHWSDPYLSVRLLFGART